MLQDRQRDSAVVQAHVGRAAADRPIHLPRRILQLHDLKEHSFTAEAVNDVVLLCYPQKQIERLGEERADFAQALCGSARRAACATFRIIS
jgi:hypothetical protein